LLRRRHRGAGGAGKTTERPGLAADATETDMDGLAFVERGAARASGLSAGGGDNDTTVRVTSTRVSRYQRTNCFVRRQDPLRTRASPDSSPVFACPAALSSATWVTASSSSPSPLCARQPNREYTTTDRKVQLATSEHVVASRVKFCPPPFECHAPRAPEHGHRARFTRRLTPFQVLVAWPYQTG
jgi:hypothetical protein